ncbi:hypothetical protein DL93DRAFT_1973490 [Clavulina sp. PMI_390]|nr:hypothetical protein DL93DRAFT_1973490 [Clavulina sp. PMI_390]
MIASMLGSLLASRRRMKLLLSSSRAFASSSFTLSPNPWRGPRSCSFVAFLPPASMTTHLLFSCSVEKCNALLWRYTAGSRDAFGFKSIMDPEFEYTNFLHNHVEQTHQFTIDFVCQRFDHPETGERLWEALLYVDGVLQGQGFGHKKGWAKNEASKAYLIANGYRMTPPF